MKRLALVLLALATALAITPAALADTFSYTFTSTQPGVLNITGTLNATEIGSSSRYNITGGTMNLYAFHHLTDSSSMLAPAGTDGSDNQISVISPFISLGGFSFLFGTEGSIYFNQYFGDRGGLWGVQANLMSNWLQPGEGADVAGIMTLTETPEPGSLFLLGTGLLGLAVILFRKAKPSHSMTFSM